ncbi:MAG: homocysteine S-methyltransferase family protein [Planctomycetota bacterium]|jgi:5-methyltetrahydrofolate--homocysteine methyltransferase
MAKQDLKERARGKVFLLDGAMGTQLIAHGVETGKCNDHLSIELPGTVLSVHQSYFEAGSDAVITNTFGATKYALARHGLSEKVEEINRAAVKIACEASGEDRYVLGDMGPTGDFLEPLGPLKADELVKEFSVQAKALAEGGVDGFIIETMTAVDEIEIAIKAVKSVSDLPIFASMSFDVAGDDFKTMMGADVETAVSKISSLGVEAVGFNCGKMSLDEYVGLAVKYLDAVEKSGAEVVIFAEPNAGLPELVDGKAVYKVSGEEFAAAVEKIHSLGINVIGGCCGTGPEHIKAVAKKLK